MRLSTLVLCCVMILCCTGLFDGTARRLRVRTGSVAALCPLLAAAGAFSTMPLPWLRIGGGAVLLLFCTVLLCRWDTSDAVALLVAACTGACGFALARIFSGFYEPGLLIALPTAAAAAGLCIEHRAALLCAVCAPLFYAVCVLLEGYYLFHTVQWDLAASEVFDAQTSGAALLFLLWRAGLPRAFRQSIEHEKRHAAG